MAKPYYYSVYLAEHDIIAEITPTDRAAYFRFTFPETDEGYIVIDSYDRGSYIKVIPEENKIIVTRPVIAGEFLKTLRIILLLCWRKHLIPGLFGKTVKCVMVKNCRMSMLAH